jgi:hypothetical protein
MSLKHWRLAALALSALVLAASPLLAQERINPTDKKAREAASFGVLESMSAETARAKALEWLQSTGKADAEQKDFDAIWSSERSVLDKVADTLMLGDAKVATLLKDARDFGTPAPIEVPALLKDTKQPAFYRANLALAYAKALATRRIHEEALEALKAVKVEDVVDPASYLFHRAVAEHAMMKKDDANRTILRLLDDVTDAPERYKMVAALMHFDMMSWKEKDLGWVSRMMNNIERRLELTRGGPVTQDMQKKVVLQLDAMIKELEDQQNQPGNGNGQGKGPPNGKNIRSSSPAQDDYTGGVGGPGNVDPKKLKELADVWGTLPDKEKTQRMLELTRNMPARHRELIETYFKNLAKSESSTK